MDEETMNRSKLALGYQRPGDFAPQLACKFLEAPSLQELHSEEAILGYFKKRSFHCGSELPSYRRY